MKQHGPKEIEIPARHFLSCYGCDFHKSKLWKSGRDPEYNHFCEHPDFPRKPLLNMGNLHKEEDGHIITPSDCPFVKQEKGTGSGTYGHGSSGRWMKSQIDYDGPAMDFEK